MQVNELITVKTNNKNQQVVSARDLHRGLGVTTRFSKWVEQNFSDFIEGEDFTTVTGGTVVESGNGTLRRFDDYAITISMAKELCMMSHSETGKIYRKYFIELEKRWNDPAEVIKRGYEFLQDENVKLKVVNKKLSAENEVIKPKALYADLLEVSKTSILVRQLAKLLTQKGYKTGEKRLFETLRQQGYLISKYGADRNMPTQKSMKLGLFEVKQNVYFKNSGVTETSGTPKVTAKGQRYFIEHFLKEKQGV